MSLDTMPVKDPNILAVALGTVTTFCGTLIFFIVKGAKASIDDVKKACIAGHKDSKKEIEKLEDEQKTFITKEYMKDEIKPVLKDFGDKMENFSKELGKLITREEHQHDMEIIHTKINRKADVEKG